MVGKIRECSFQPQPKAFADRKGLGHPGSNRYRAWAFQVSRARISEPSRTRRHRSKCSRVPETIARGILEIAAARPVRPGKPTAVAEPRVGLVKSSPDHGRQIRSRLD